MVFRVFWGILQDFAEVPEFRESATARNIRSPVNIKHDNYYHSPVKCEKTTTYSVV